jgi:hypothetical protein
MGKPAFFLVLLALGLTLAGGCTDDSPPQVPEIGPANTAGLYFDRLARRTSLRVRLGDVFHLYVIGFDLEGDLQRSHFAIGGLNAKEFTEVFQILETQVYPVGIGTNEVIGTDNMFALDHGECYAGEGAVILLRLALRLVNSVQDFRLTLEPLALFPDYDCPTSPVTIRCDGGKLCMDTAYEGGAVINPTR